MARRVFISKDGKQHATASDAERHDAMMKAINNLRKAQKCANQAIAESHKTKDGYPFEFGCLRDYWSVVMPDASRPYLRKVSFGYGGANWEADADYEPIRISLTTREDNRNIRYNIGELYRYENNAKAALLVAFEMWLGWQKDDIEKEANPNE